MVEPFAELYGGIISCDSPINAGPMTYALRASIHALNTWIADGTAPPKSPRLQMTGDGAAPFVLDASGNVVGGIRTPQVEAPIATLSGLGQSGSNFCGIFGTTKPFETTKLSSLYPSHAAFVRAWNTATDRGGEGRVHPPGRRQEHQGRGHAVDHRELRTTACPRRTPA